METIVFKFNKIANSIAIFLMITTVIGIILYVKVKKFQATPRQVKLYGMFLGMRNIDVIMLSIAMIQGVFISYVALVRQVDILLYGMILLITSISFILYQWKSVFYEAVNFIAQIVAMYFNKTLYQYSIEIETNLALKTIQMVLSTFMIMYAIYTFLVHLESMIQKNKNVRRNTSEKE